MLTNEYLKRVYETVLTRNPGESEFHQAVLEVLESLESVVEQHPEYEQNGSQNERACSFGTLGDGYADPVAVNLPDYFVK